MTNLSGNLSGYDDGARFLWWYQRHGRLASDGDSYAAYFGVAITVKNGDCVDIHEGDRMQVVDADGSLAPDTATASRWAAATVGRHASCGIPVPSTT